MGDQIRIHDIIKIIQKRLLLIVTVTALSVLISGIVSYFFLTPIYESSTQLLVNQKKSDQESDRSIDVRTNLELINTYRVIIESPAILDLVKEEMNLDRSIKELAKQISVSSEQNSQVLTITVQDPNRTVAVNIANTIASQFENKIPVLMNIDNVTILSQASEEASNKPVKPLPILIMMITFTVSLLMIIGIVFLIEYFDDTISSEQDVQSYLELPLLGSIPVKTVRDFQIEMKRNAKVIRVKNRWGFFGFFKKKETLDTRQLITVINPKSPVSEQYRTIRTNIEYSNIDHENRMIMITSSIPGEGKTTTSANLAVVFAQHGKKVLLIDADFRKPMVHNVFKKQNLIGITSVIIMKKSLEEAIQETKIRNLYLLASGPIPPNPSELLSSKSMSNLLITLRKQFDLIIIDTPPILPVTDAQVLANQCDGVILVFNDGKTKLEHAEKTKSLLLNARARVIGAVLNNTKANYLDYYYYSSDH